MAFAPRPRKQLVWTVAVCLWCLAVLAGAAPVITAPGQAGSAPADLVVAGEYLYFTADDGISGRELWRMDRDFNAALVADILPGPGGSEPFLLRPAGEVLYFFVRYHGRFLAGENVALWATKGTSETTRRIVGPIAVLDPVQAEGLGEDLIFAAASAGIGRELWLARWEDGNYALFHEFRPGPADGYVNSALTRWVRCGDWLVLSGLLEGSEQPAVWRCKTVPPIVEALRTAEGSVLPATGLLRGLAGDRRVFLLTARAGTEIWSGDLSLDNLRWANPDQPFLEVKQLELAGDQLYFQTAQESSGQELWRSDGDGVELVADIVPGKEGGNPYYLTAMEDKLIFVAQHPDHGGELWFSDGTPGGTRMILDMAPGPASSAPYQLCRLGKVVLFSCESDAYGEELWRTDGTEAGTWLVKDIHEGLPDAEPYVLTRFNERVVFTARHAEYGEELWVTDGTPEGTQVAAQVRPPLRQVQSSSPEELTPLDGLLYFTANSPEFGRELWRSDGTEAGTRCIADVVPGPAGSHPQELRAAGGLVYFSALNADGVATAWAWDPGLEALSQQTSPNPPQPPTLRDVLPASCLAQLRLHDELDWAMRGEEVFFAARDAVHGIELWWYNTARGTCGLAADIFPGVPSSAPAEFLTIGDKVYFAAWNAPLGRELWASDGTAEGTRNVVDFLSFPHSASPTDLVAWHEGLAFLYRNDAGVATVGYRAVLRQEPPWDLSYYGEEQPFPARSLTPVASNLYYVSDHPAYGEELWCFDAETLRPRLVKDIAPTLVVKP